jgi:hypothetical protein
MFTKFGTIIFSAIGIIRALSADEDSHARNFMLIGRLERVGLTEIFWEAHSQNEARSVRVHQRNNRTLLKHGIDDRDRSLEFPSLLELREYLFVEHGVWLIFTRRDPTFARPYIIAYLANDFEDDQYFDVKLNNKIGVVRSIFSAEDEFLTVGLQLSRFNFDLQTYLVKANIHRSLLQPTEIEDD